MPDLPEQNAEELRWLLDQVRGLKSILEIGSRTGGTLMAMASVCEPGARICSIDLGHDTEGWNRKPSADALRETIAGINGAGYKAECLIADSKHVESIKWALERGPYDFVFIDGDHTFEGVRADWRNYGHMGKLVGFHDILNGHLGVCLLWHKIRLVHNVIERSDAHSAMGIGIVIMDQYENPKAANANAGPR